MPDRRRIIGDRILLQITVGEIDWSLFACPVNIVVLGLYIAGIVAMHLPSQTCLFLRLVESLFRSRLFSFMGGRHDGGDGTYPAAPSGHARRYAWIFADDFVLAFRSALFLDGHCIGIDDTSCQISIQMEEAFVSFSIMSDCSLH